MFRSVFPSSVVALTGVLAVSGAAFAGYYKTIPMQGTFQSWSGVPVVATNTVDPNAPVNITQVQMANDSTNLYIKLYFGGATITPNTGNNTMIYMGVNSTNNAPGSGFNLYGLDEVYSNTAIEANTAFTQTGANFNSGGTIDVADNFIIDIVPTAVIYGSNNVATTEEEISIPLNSTQTDTSTGGFTGTIFPSATPFTVAFYTSPSTGDHVFTGPITYQLATPEPAEISLLLAGGIGAMSLVRRARRLSAR
ncbi:MAG: PEP-CTERM sorting domain-containing protein [Phycisphaerae bacterium]